jgi:hypothetical protein
MLKTNSVYTGILAAFIFPAISVYVTYLLRYTTAIINKPLLPYLGAIALNLIAIRILMRKELDQTARGIMLTTFVFMLIVFILKFHPIT